MAPCRYCIGEHWLSPIITSRTGPPAIKTNLKVVGESEVSMQERHMHPGGHVRVAQRRGGGDLACLVATKTTRQRSRWCAAVKYMFNQASFSWHCRLELLCFLVVWVCGNRHGNEPTGRDA